MYGEKKCIYVCIYIWFNMQFQTSAGVPGTHPPQIREDYCILGCSILFLRSLMMLSVFSCLFFVLSFLSVFQFLLFCLQV